MTLNKNAILVTMARIADWRYDGGMTNVAKVAVSIPAATLKSLEKARLRLRKTRSAVVTEAIEHWLRAGEVGADDQIYVTGYLRQPEQTGSTAEIAAAVVETWEPWR